MKLPAVVKGPCPPALTPQETCWAPHLSFHLFPVGGDPLPWAPSPLSLRDVLCLDPQDPACTSSLCLSDLSRTSALPRSLPLVLQIQRALLPQALCTCPSPASRLHPPCIQGLPLTILLEPTPRRCVSSPGFMYCLFVLVLMSPRGAGRARFMFATGSQCRVGALHGEGPLLCYSGVASAQVQTGNK